MNLKQQLVIFVAMLCMIPYIYGAYIGTDEIRALSSQINIAGNVTGLNNICLSNGTNCAGSGSQTPWSSNINGARFNLSNVSMIWANSTVIDGIGNDNPLGYTTPLVVRSRAGDTANILIDSTTNHWPDAALILMGKDFGGKYGGNTIGGYYIGTSNNNDLRIANMYNMTSGALTNAKDGSTGFNLDRNNNVGLGTTTPRGPFDINSVQYVTPTSNEAFNIAYGFGSNYYNLGYTYSYIIYAYKVVNGIRIYSEGHQVYNGDDGANNNYYMNYITWDAAPGADGYRVVVSYDDWYAAGQYDSYYIDTTNLAVELDGGCDALTSSCYSYEYPMIVSPTSYGTDIYVNPTGDLLSTKNAYFEQMYVNSKVGVGTTSPQNAFDVRYQNSNGAMPKSAYEAASFERNADMKLGIYTSYDGGPIANAGTSLVMGNTGQAIYTGGYEGWEIQGTYADVPDNMIMRWNALHRGSDGVVYQAATNLLTVKGDGTVAVNGAQFGGIWSTHPQLVVGADTTSYMFEVAGTSKLDTLQVAKNVTIQYNLTVNRLITLTPITLPTSAPSGTFAINTTDKRPYYYNGTAWNRLAFG